MRKLAVLALCAAATAAAAPAFAADVGVSIGINQPGVYGRIDIGAAPPPVVYTQPVLVAPSPRAARLRPVYLYVPAEQQRDWRRYCGRYGACGQPVYFVQEQWVRQRYERAHPGWHDVRGRRDERVDDRRHERRDAPADRRDWNGPDRDHR